MPGYATASVEGRIAVEYFDPSPAIQEKKYAFKCHRQTIDDADHVWPVNALAFHPTYNTFASGGSDATVSIWDHKVKKRLRQYTKYNAPVAALAFSADGSRLAIGASYTWDAGEEGARTAERPSLFVRELGEEVKVRLLLGQLAAVCVRGLNSLGFYYSRKDGVLASVGCRVVSDVLIAVQGRVRRYIPICLLGGFGTNAVVVYCQYVFVWHDNPRNENAYSVLNFGTLTFIYWGLLSVMLKRLSTWA